MVVLPYRELPLGKKKQVGLMFDHIAGKYDLLNHLLSFNMDKLWRRKAIRCLNKSSPETILDVATGTGDFAIAAVKTGARKIAGVDISEKMLDIARRKCAGKNLSGIVEFVPGDAENLPFPGGSFHAALCGFGVRNFENPELGLTEIHRVLKPGGHLVILEFSKPAKPLFRKLFNIYFTSLLPGIGHVISGDRSAYTYLPDSVLAFPGGEDFLRLLRDRGFRNCTLKPMTFGIVTLYSGYKP